jgi:hypothetical protein
MNRIAAIGLVASFVSSIALGALGASLAGCSGDSGTGMPGSDVDSGTPEEDSATPPHADSGSPPPVDGATPPATDAGNTPDSAAPPAGDGGSGAFGDTCTQNSDCQSMMCEPFRQQSIMLCTKACTTATQATDCPAPSAGTCTPKGYCRFN